MTAKRLGETQSSTIAESASASSALDIREYDSALVLFPAAFTGSTVTYQASDDHDGTFAAIYDTTNTAVASTVRVGAWVEIPAAAMKAKFLKIVSGSTETAARTLTIAHK